MNLPCAVIEDLLPAYYDHSCSQESQEAVEKHLQTCRRCHRLFTTLSQELPLEQGTEPQLGSVEKTWKKKRTLDLFHGVVVMLLVIGIVIPLVVYMNYFVTIPASLRHYEAREVSMLSNGQIAFALWADDPQYLESIFYEEGEDGAFYVVPQRRIFAGASTPSWSQHFTVTCPGDVTAIYVGPVGKGFLVWEQGQPLPAASPRLEQEAGVP